MDKEINKKVEDEMGLNELFKLCFNGLFTKEELEIYKKQVLDSCGDNVELAINLSFAMCEARHLSLQSQRNDTSFFG